MQYAFNLSIYIPISLLEIILNNRLTLIKYPGLTLAYIINVVPTHQLPPVKLTHHIIST